MVLGAFDIELQYIAFITFCVCKHLQKVDRKGFNTLSAIDVFVTGIKATGDSICPNGQLVRGAREIEGDNFTTSGPESSVEYLHAFWALFTAVV
jgi:hypothetical protein